MFRTSFKVLSKFRHLVRISTQRLLCTSLGPLGMPLINSLRVDVFGPPVALSHSGQQIEEKSARVQRERESDHETAIHPSVVSNLAHTPSLDHVPGHPVRAVARPLTKLVCAGLSVLSRKTHANKDDASDHAQVVDELQ